MTFKDFLSKLASRKFLTMLTGVVTAILVYKGASDNTVAQATSVIGAFGTMITYIFAQGSVDKAATKTQATTTLINSAQPLASIVTDTTATPADTTTDETNAVG